MVLLLISGAVVVGVDGEKKSFPSSFLRVVSQGSMLSPFIFNIYLKLLSKIVCKDSNERYHQYVGNFQSYISIPAQAIDGVNFSCLEAKRI